MKNLSTFCLLLVISLALPQLMFSQTADKGTSYFTPMGVEQQETANGIKIIRNQLSGINISENSGSPFHLASVSCKGINLVNKSNESDFSTTFCDVIDKEGDVAVYSSEDQGDGRIEFKLLGGTGKFKNLSGEGTARVVGTTSDGKIMFEWEATYKM